MQKTRKTSFPPFFWVSYSQRREKKGAERALHKTLTAAVVSKVCHLLILLYLACKAPANPPFTTPILHRTSDISLGTRFEFPIA
jgi:hypothetical protein